MTIRTLIVDDSPTYRHLLGLALREDPRFTLVGTASDGADGVAQAVSLRPDLVLMDVVMPGMGGVEATAQVMREAPCPVVVLSTQVEGAAHPFVFQALGAGAVEACPKPRELHLPVNRARFLTLLVAMAAVRVVRRRAPSSLPERTPVAGGARLVVIGASTGGPSALASLVSALPAAFPAPIIVAQHLATGFAGGLRNWLAAAGPLPIVLVDAPRRLEPGTVYLAADERHLEVDGSWVVGRPTGGEIPSPSVDRLFGSAASWASAAVGVLLSGMGADGAAGMSMLREAGAHTIVQDAATSLVYGMPRVARERGAACEESALDAMAARLVALTATTRVERS